MDDHYLFVTIILSFSIGSAIFFTLLFNSKVEITMLFLVALGVWINLLVVIQLKRLRKPSEK